MMDGPDFLAAEDAIVARPPVLETEPWDAGDDDEPIPPRAFLLGTQLARDFLSGITSPGGVGKTALRMVQYLSLATGRSLSGDHVFRRGRVLVVSLEDSRDELRRRLKAAMLHHNVSNDEIRGHLILWTPKGLRLAEVGDSDRRVRSGELEVQLRALVEKYQIDLISLDPFVKAHGVEENDNGAIDAVCSLLAKLAVEMHCAIDLVHHDGKGVADPGNPNRARGASAWRDAARLVYTLTPMGAEEAAEFGVSDADRRSLVRLDSAKLNIAPPAVDARWFKLIGVKLGNGTLDYPNGDEVQTVEPWQPPDFWQKFGIAAANEILDLIDVGLPNGRRYSAAPQASEDRAAWRLVLAQKPEMSEPQTKKIISTWLSNGVIETREAHDPMSRRPEKGLYVNPAKRPG